MNNIERIRESFKVLPMDFSYEKLLVAGEKTHSMTIVDEWRRTIETIIVGFSEDILHRIYQILSKVITNMEMELKQNLFHLIGTPDASEPNETIQPLLNFLHSQLIPYREYLIPQNLTRLVHRFVDEMFETTFFFRLLELIWVVLIDQLLYEVEYPSSTVSDHSSFHSLNYCLVCRDRCCPLAICRKVSNFCSNSSATTSFLWWKKRWRATNSE